jgi:predicted glycoside hydrolase/deacetylase ChbG (UPF0249 family)
MIAQVQKTRELAGVSFSHVDFHMGLHRLPRLYEVFLDVAQRSGTGRIRTHVYRMGMESAHPRSQHVIQMLQGPTRLPKYLWNIWARKKSLARGLAMPDQRVAIRDLGFRDDSVTLRNYAMLLRNLPEGISELTVHPGYVNADLARWTRYIGPREQELAVLSSAEFRRALQSSGVRLAGFRDIPVRSAAVPMAA